MKNSMISNIKKSIMGTTQFDAKFPGMRKAQNFLCYPLSSGDSAKTVTIQSDTRIAQIDTETGKVLMSASHSNGAYFHTLQMDQMKGKAKTFTLSGLDLSGLKMHIFTTAGKSVGNVVIQSDNSGAQNIFDL